MKKWFFLSFLLFFSLTIPLYADCEGGQCPMKSGSHGHEGREHGKSQCPIVGKFMKKTHFYLEHKDELGLKDDQVKAIKELQLKVKKASILQEAEMKIFQLELTSKLKESKVDVEGLTGEPKTLTEETTGARTIKVKVEGRMDFWPSALMMLIWNEGLET